MTQKTYFEKCSLYFVKGWNQVLIPKKFYASRRIITELVGILSFSKFFKGVKNESVNFFSMTELIYTPPQGAVGEQEPEARRLYAWTS